MAFEFEPLICSCGNTILGRRSRRYCTTCRPMRPRENWKRRETDADKAAQKEYQARRRKDPAVREQLNAEHRRWRHSRPAVWLLGSIRRRANAKGILFDLTIDDIVIPERCPILGIEITKSSKGPCDNSPSVDRIVPLMGYTKGNIQVVSMRANRIKNDATSKELRLIADYMDALP